MNLIENQMSILEIDLGITMESLRRSSEFEENWLEEHKMLSLVIDLDKTLIDTIRVESESDANHLISNSDSKKEDFLFFTEGEHYLVRFRPYLKEFLKEISTKFRLQIYTLAKTSYAEIILKEIDPKTDIFYGRIYSREREIDEAKKYIEHLFPISQRLVLVLDDNEDVWRDQIGIPFSGLVNLLPFDYFYIDKERKITISKNWNYDDTLLKIRDILFKCHSDFYNNFIPKSNILVTLDNIKRSILNGCYIYFMHQFKDNNEQMKVIKQAEQFGATVLLDFVPYLTHFIVISGYESTELNQALEYNGIFIINFLWFKLSVQKFQKQKEEYFPHQEFPIITNGELIRSDPPEEFDISDSDLKGLFSDPSLDSDLNGDDWLEKLDLIPTDEEEEEEEKKEKKN